jgi:molybdopterin converting factor small subunit
MGALRVRLKLFASLGKWRGNLSPEIDLEEPGSVRSLILQAGIPEKDAAIIIINGKRASLGDRLNEGDEVLIFPLIGGG